MSLKEKIGVCLLTGALALNSCTSTSEYKVLESKVKEQGSKIESLEQKLRESNTIQFRDVDELYLKMIAPTVKVELNTHSSSSTGAGTVLYSKKEDNGLAYSYILTSAHVVTTRAEDFAITVHNYSLSQDSIKDCSAEVIAMNKANDLAILEVISDEVFPTANLIPKENINVVKIFDRVYTVGCPTDDPPLQSYGELTNKMPSARTTNFWRINAPTAHGNSGGGVYLESTKELMGVLCKGETEEVEHQRKDGRSSPTKKHLIEIPHLSIITSPIAIYSFLEEENLQFLYDSSQSREECFERRER